MKINYFDRQLIPDRISIEKVFSIIKSEIIKKGFEIRSYENPYTLKNIIKALFFFKRNQGTISHITGDIHWACFLLDPDKTILTIHDIVGVHSYSSVWKTKLYLLIWLYLPVFRLKYITVISQKTKDEILKYYPSAAPKIRVINNPLTGNLYFRKIINKNPEDVKILIVGTRINKNIERILKATSNLNCQITIIGEQSVEQKNLIKESNSSILGYNFVNDEELEGFYREADILCFTSTYEGFGMPIIEAQANGCAVLTSDMEPMRSVAGNGALFVDPLDTEDIKIKLEVLLNDQHMRKILVEKGYENVKRFIPETIAEQYAELYRTVKNNCTE